MRIFISGGCKNGKSTYAQNLAVKQKKDGVPLYYVATMTPHDSEDEERVLRHQEERFGMGFETLEIPVNITTLLDCSESGGSFLLDSLTALMANEMFSSEEFDPGAAGRVISGIAEVLKNTPDIVIVSDAIYSDAFVFEDFTENYRRALAAADRACAELSDVVLEVVFGNVVVHKGGRDSVEKIL